MGDGRHPACSKAQALVSTRNPNLPRSAVIVAEAFLPTMNGVTNSVLHVLHSARSRGIDVTVIAPGAREPLAETPTVCGFDIVRVPTVQVPLINSLPIGVPTRTVMTTLKRLRPDVVHVASPFVLGAAGAWAARRLGIPTVAIFQTDVAAFASTYHLGPLHNPAWRWIRTVHNWCDRTLAPSTASITDLHRYGVRNVYHWGRGVDSTLFSPHRISSALRREWSTGGSDGTQPIIVGFVGRLASEKSVERLAVLDADPRFHLVIVGDGPERPHLQRILPHATFIGALRGKSLAHAYASFDVFVHPGERETFCQAIQEALASGVPVVAPRKGGPIDLVQDGTIGRLLPPGTAFAQQLPEAVAHCAQHRAAMSTAARASVAHRTWPALCDELFAHWAAVAR